MASSIDGFAKSRTFDYHSTLYCKNTAFAWWERLPAANIALTPCCRRISPAGGVPQRSMTRLSQPGFFSSRPDSSNDGFSPPGMLCRSSSSIFKPFCAMVAAAARPPLPAPITTASYSPIFTPLDRWEGLRPMEERFAV